MSYSGFQSTPNVPVDPLLAEKLAAFLDLDSNIRSSVSPVPLKGRRSVAVFYIVELKCKIRNTPLPPFKVGYLRQWVRVVIKKTILKSITILFKTTDIPIESGMFFI